MHRILKPGGRVAVSDIALKKPLPETLARDVMAYVGCIAGAVFLDDYCRGLEEAGFLHVQVIDAGADLNAYAQVADQIACCAPAMTSATGLPMTDACQPQGVPTEVHNALADLLRKYDINEYAASVRVYALKGR